MDNGCEGRGLETTAMGVMQRTPAVSQAIAKRTRRWTIGTILTHAVLILFSLYVALPLYWLIISVMKSTHELFTTNGLVPPSNISGIIQNFQSFFTYDGGMAGRWFLNALIYSSVASAFGVLLCTLAGYGLAFLPFRGQRLVWGSIVVAIMLPAAALVIPIYLVDTVLLHLQGSALAFILPSIVSPFGVFFMRIYLVGAVPKELLDAGRVDGAGEFRIVWNIVKGIAMPGMLTLAVILFIVTWNNFFLAFIVLSHTRVFPLTVGLVYLATLLSGTSAGSVASAVTYPEIIAGSLLCILPLLVLLVITRNRIAEGLGGLGGLGGGD